MQLLALVCVCGGGQLEVSWKYVLLPHAVRYHVLDKACFILCCFVLVPSVSEEDYEAKLPVNKLRKTGQERRNRKKKISLIIPQLLNSQIWNSDVGKQTFGVVPVTLTTELRVWLHSSTPALLYSRLFSYNRPQSSYPPPPPPPTNKCLISYTLRVSDTACWKYETLFTILYSELYTGITGHFICTFVWSILWFFNPEWKRFKGRNPKSFQTFWWWWNGQNFIQKSQTSCKGAWWKPDRWGITGEYYYMTVFITV